MKKISLFLILFISLIIPQRTQAQKNNWLTLESDASSINAAKQLIMLTIKASLNVQVVDAALTLRYDPACLRVTSHHPGTLLTGASSTVTAQPGQFDIAYRFQDKYQGNMGEGSLMSIQLETLKLCTSTLSISSNSIVLKVLDTKGIRAKLTGLEYRTLSIHLTESLHPTVTAIPVIPPVQRFSQTPIIDNTYLFLLTLIVLPIAGVLAYVLFRRSTAPKPMKPAPNTAGILESKVPALIQNGHAILLSQPRTQLSRHIEIIQRGTGFYIADTSSQPSTLLNGNHIGRGYYFLHHGDHLQLGSTGSYQFVKPQ